MTDRELLENAAKAAGLDALKLKHNNDLWNPLTDDGDAFRLAVKLSIRIYPPEPHLYGRNSDKASTNLFGKFWEDSDDVDPYAATRRAIVKAAAEIGKAMP